MATDGQAMAELQDISTFFVYWTLKFSSLTAYEVVIGSV
jgi:hypothetical protein